jgi:hypothetical protein
LQKPAMLFVNKSDLECKMCYSNINVDPGSTSLSPFLP